MSDELNRLRAELETEKLLRKEDLDGFHRRYDEHRAELDQAKTELVASRISEGGTLNLLGHAERERDEARKERDEWKFWKMKASQSGDRLEKELATERAGRELAEGQVRELEKTLSTDPKVSDLVAQAFRASVLEIELTTLRQQHAAMEGKLVLEIKRTHASWAEAAELKADAVKLREALGRTQKVLETLHVWDCNVIDGAADPSEGLPVALADEFRSVLRSLQDLSSPHPGAARGEGP